MGRNRVPAEDLARVGEMIKDGASVLDIVRTTGVARETILKNYPGASWSHADAGSLGRQIRIFNQATHQPRDKRL